MFSFLPRWGRADYSMFFRRYDRRARYFDHVIDWLKDTGLIDYYHKRYLLFENIKEQAAVDEEKLVLEHFLLPMVFGATGLTVGAVILAVELYHNQRREWEGGARNRHLAQSIFPGTRANSIAIKPLFLNIL